MNDNIHLDAPNIGNLEKDSLIKAIDSGYVSTIGPYVAEFEGQFSAYLKGIPCVSVQSGTAALHMALYELGLGQGDEVIVPAITFIATVNPVTYVGAKPVFVDVDINTWNIDPVEIEKAITDKTKAIIVVHLFGNPCNMNRILEIAAEHNLHVIEDATESLGATYNGELTGTLGQVGCFSFNGNKIITTGGGGMISTKNVQQAEHIKFLVNQGRDASKGYFHPEIGFNYRMTNLEAALGLAQMERLTEFLEKKRLFYKIYQEMFIGIEEIEMQKEEDNAVSSVWLNSIKIDTKKLGISIPEIQFKLKEKGIPTRRIFNPIIDFPPYLQYKKGDYKNSYNIYENGLNLPSSTLNIPETIYYVASELLEVLSIKK